MKSFLFILSLGAFLPSLSFADSCFGEFPQKLPNSTIVRVVENQTGQRLHFTKHVPTPGRKDPFDSFRFLAPIQHDNGYVAYLGVKYVLLDETGRSFLRPDNHPERYRVDLFYVTNAGRQTKVAELEFDRTNVTSQAIGGKPITRSVRYFGSVVTSEGQRQINLNVRQFVFGTTNLWQMNDARMTVREL